MPNIFDLVIITGPPASGKMTVGRALSEKTGYKLFHNHLSLELVNQFFDWSTPPFQRLDRLIRFSIFEEVAASEQRGLIFTLVWAFDLPEDAEYVRQIMAVFRARDLRVCIVELRCDLEERLRRNRHPDRLAAKPSKRDAAVSEQRLLKEEETYRMNSREDELGEFDIFRIDNTELAAAAVALTISRKFGIKISGLD